LYTEYYRTVAPCTVDKEQHNREKEETDEEGEWRQNGNR
jgi:hypothetical protein